MAPKRGGSSGESSGSSGSTVPTCPGFFSTTKANVYRGADVAFFAVFLGLTIALCRYLWHRKNTQGPGEKLISLPYIGALIFLLMSVLFKLCHGNWY
jgi:hypothetical protein